MEIDDHDERYDSLAEYSKNYDIYKQIQGNNGDGYISFPNEVIPGDTEDRIYIVSNCLRIKNYLMKFNDKENCQNNNCCEYINYILNKTIRTLEKRHEPIFNFYTSYINHYSNGQIKNLCASKINHLKEEKYNKTDQLYNAYEICRLFIDNKHDTSTCSLAKLCATSYNNIFIKNSELNDVKFCRALKNFKDVLEANNLTSKIKCSGENHNLMSYPESCTQLLENSEHSTSSMDQQDGILEEHVRSEGPSGQQKEKMVEIRADYTTSPSSFGTTLPISLFSSGMGGLLILLSFYKFTPLGQWLKLRTQRFGGITKNFDEELYEMQQPTSEYEERNSEYNGYKIAYNSL
ncbi:PIR Superfamily Protein [Plasmodium ovale wallikeri]|uniref:PIR Superfamily Protein n=1 Tax=Plasmodium ovale wallikeri TaxID=864142 RepID=A0A1A9AFN0_PLAOA|nr:PIR Superfamily Protein [Plasmodium ovale wallikeri]